MLSRDKAPFNRLSNKWENIPDLGKLRILVERKVYEATLSISR